MRTNKTLRLSKLIVALTLLTTNLVLTSCKHEDPVTPAPISVDDHGGHGNDDPSGDDHGGGD